MQASAASHVAQQHRLNLRNNATPAPRQPIKTIAAQINKTKQTNKKQQPTCCCCAWCSWPPAAAAADTVLIIFNGCPAAIADVTSPPIAFPDDCTSLNIWGCPAEKTKKKSKRSSREKTPPLTSRIAYHKVRAAVRLAHRADHHNGVLPLNHRRPTGLAKRSPLQNGDSGQRTFHRGFSRVHSTPKLHRNVRR